MECSLLKKKNVYFQRLFSTRIKENFFYRHICIYINFPTQNNRYYDIYNFPKYLLRLLKHPIYVCYIPS